MPYSRVYTGWFSFLTQVVLSRREGSHCSSKVNRGAGGQAGSTLFNAETALEHVRTNSSYRLCCSAFIPVEIVESMW
jgi:hypothetical protein